jgi:hypothetical protein
MKNKAAIALGSIHSKAKTAAARRDGKLGGKRRKMSTRDIVRELYNIKSGIEADNFTRENIDALIAKLA